MLTLGRLEHGEYVDDFEGVHPDVLEKYYGSSSKEDRNVGNGGASESDGEAGIQVSDEEVDGNWEDEEHAHVPMDVDDATSSESDDEFGVQTLEGLVEADLANNFKHKAVKVPRHQNPFAGNEEAYALFQSAFEAIVADGVLPAGYGTRPDEWMTSQYPTYEILRSGRRSRKQLRVILPEELWLPRAEIWTQALFVMGEVLKQVV